MCASPCVRVSCQAARQCMPIVSRFGAETYACSVFVQACKSADQR